MLANDASVGFTDLIEHELEVSPFTLASASSACPSLPFFACPLPACPSCLPFSALLACPSLPALLCLPFACLPFSACAFPACPSLPAPCLPALACLPFSACSALACRCRPALCFLACWPPTCLAGMAFHISPTSADMHTHQAAQQHATGCSTLPARRLRERQTACNRRWTVLCSSSDCM